MAIEVPHREGTLQAGCDEIAMQGSPHTGNQLPQDDVEFWIRSWNHLLILFALQVMQHIARTFCGE